MEEDKLFKRISEFLATDKNFDNKALTSEMLDFIIVEYLGYHGEADEDTIIAFIRWIEKGLIDHALIELFFKGFIEIDDPEGKFDNPDNIRITVKNPLFGEKSKQKLN